MNNHTFKALTLLLPLYACFSNEALSVTFYENNFNAGTTPKYYVSTTETNGDPLWSLAPTFPDVYGPGNHFNVTNTSSHSGSYSLRFAYEGLNGICNTCGSYFADHIATGHDGVDYFISEIGEDLSIEDNPSTTTKADDGPKAIPGRFIYNRDGGFSKWEVVSVANENAKNDRINLKLVNKGVNGENTIKSGDGIAITRSCGIDGTIGITGGENDIVRRSDCNSVIMWFANVEPQPPGSSIFRRAYLKQEITSPNVRQKLHYLRPDRDGPNQGEIVLFGHTASGTVVPQVSGASRYGSPLAIYVPGSGLPADLTFERSVWYYVQEEYKAATPDLVTDPTGNTYNTDGAYRLWFSKTGEEPAQGFPTLEIVGLALPPINGGFGTHISFWGNLQHDSHARGSWYIDDVIVSDTFNPIVPYSGTDTSPPKFPAVEK